LALSSSYVLRESAGNLRRNLFMTIAAILTMAVSLTALGAVLIMRQAIAKASVQSQGGVEMAIFLNPNSCPGASGSAPPSAAAGGTAASSTPSSSTTSTTVGAASSSTPLLGGGNCLSQQEIAAIKQELDNNPGVRSSHYVDKQDAYREFKEIFSGNTDIINALTVADMPPSYRVVPTNPHDINQLGKIFSGQPGVARVSYPAQEIANLLAQFRKWRIGGLVLAVGVLIGAVALIVNTIQLAIFARRREVAVMKLVGATNWFIRIPFMLEGLIHGIAGAVMAFFAIYFARNAIAGVLPSQTLLGVNTLHVSPHEAVLTGVVLLAFGAIVGVAGSAFAVRRYLDV
jgi:cell division transport system permease protein